MDSHMLQSLPSRRGKVRMGGIQWFGLLLTLCLSLAGCRPSGDSSGDVTPPTSPSENIERQAIENLIDLYREALLAEDIDRVQSLLQSAPAQANANPQTRAFATLSAFRQALSDTFRSRTVLAYVLQDVVIASDRRSASFLEVESTLDPDTLTQQTQVFRTTFQLARTEVGDVVNFRIDAVTRQGPLVAVTTPGLLVAGPPAPIAIRSSSAGFTLSEVELSEPVAGTVQRLTAVDAEASGQWHLHLTHRCPVAYLARAGHCDGRRDPRS